MFASASNQVERTTEKEQHIQPHRKLFSYSVQIYPGMNLGQTNPSNSNDNLSNNSNTIQLQLTDLNVIPQRSGFSDDLNRSQSQIQIQNQELDEYRALEEKMEKRMVFVHFPDYHHGHHQSRYRTDSLTKIKLTKYFERQYIIPEIHRP